MSRHPPKNGRRLSRANTLPTSEEAVSTMNQIIMKGTDKKAITITNIYRISHGRTKYLKIWYRSIGFSSHKHKIVFNLLSVIVSWYDKKYISQTCYGVSNDATCYLKFVKWQIGIWNRATYSRATFALKFIVKYSCDSCLITVLTWQFVELIIVSNWKWYIVSH